MNQYFDYGAIALALLAMVFWRQLLMIAGVAVVYVILTHQPAAKNAELKEEIISQTVIEPEKQNPLKEKYLKECEGWGIAKTECEIIWSKE